MKFSLEIHYRLNPRGSPIHDDPNCFCNRYQDGQEMWEPSNAPEPSNVFTVTVKAPIARDPSQSRQPWEREDEDEHDGRPMKGILED